MHSRVVFHPLFLVDLVQMMRYGEVEQAVDLAASELTAALESDDDDGEAGKGGPVCVPTHSRAAAHGYETSTSATTRRRGLRQ